MTPIDALLERLAKLVCVDTTGKVESGDFAAVIFTLRGELKPLLLAGQAMRDLAQNKTPGGCYEVLTHQAWDRALKGGRDGN